MDAWWTALLREQRSGRFPDLAGGAAALTLPISDRLLTRVIAQAIAERSRASSPIGDLDIVVSPGDILTIRGRLANAPIPLKIEARLAIERQPQLPDSPILVVAIVSRGLLGMSAGLLKYTDVLPPGVRFDDGRFIIDLRALAARYGAAELLSYLTELRVTTADRVIVVHARAALPPAD